MTRTRSAGGGGHSGLALVVIATAQLMVGPRGGREGTAGDDPAREPSSLTLN